MRAGKKQQKKKPPEWVVFSQPVEEPGLYSGADRVPRQTEAPETGAFLITAAQTWTRRRA